MGGPQVLSQGFSWNLVGEVKPSPSITWPDLTSRGAAGAATCQYAEGGDPRVRGGGRVRGADLRCAVRRVQPGGAFVRALGL